MLKQFTKDPQATLDYTIDWSAWLGTDAIATSTWVLDAGITQANASMSGAQATVWVSGGVAGHLYSVTNRITTAAGRTDDRSILIRVADR